MKTQRREDVTKWVDPFIGVGWPGNCLCGPYLPYSLVRLAPDCMPPTDTTGYASGRPIKWFSHTHVAGTGGNGRYGNIGLVPFTDPASLPPASQEPLEEKAEAGYYSVLLKRSGVKVELTSTPRVGVHRYIFPKAARANVLINVGAVIRVGEGENSSGGVSTGGFIECVSDSEVVGRGDFKGGWGHSFPYSVFFCARFNMAASDKLVGNNAGLHSGVAEDGPECKAVLTFGDAREVCVNVGVSFVSVAKARASLDREVGGKDFDAVRNDARATWNRSLSRIRVDGGTETQRKMFHTMFYRLLCMPTDLGVNDENPLWESKEQAFTDYYCLWDSVRNANSFLGLFDPERETALLNSLLDVAGHIGWIPDAWIAGHSAFIQGGSSADVLFCEAALKGFPGIDYEKALACMRKNAEQVSPDPSLYGRYLEDYASSLGYVSTRAPQGSSRHVEYAYQDWCIGSLAAKLGHADVAKAYLESSKKIWNLWRDDLKSISPRRPDGSWVEDFVPDSLRPDCWADPHFYEGSGHAWSFNIHHDMHGLISRHGGAEAFVRHLDKFFHPDNRHPWKEIVLHLPYLYVYAGRPDLTSERVRSKMQQHYRPARNGLDDNEDMGCQSSFYMCSALGLYPIMGQDIYILSTPVFSSSEIALGNTGKTLTIEAPGADDEHLYIKSATLDGKPLNRAWLRHSEIANGGVLRYELATAPGEWGRKDVPPSPSV